LGLCTTVLNDSTHLSDYLAPVHDEADITIRGLLYLSRYNLAADVFCRSTGAVRLC
jgi:hypothetical protein